MPILRDLARTPRFSFSVIAMFALGIAANTAVFSVFNGLFLSPLPFPDPSRLLYVNEDAPRFGRTGIGVNYADFDAWRSGNGAFENLAIFKDGDGANLSGVGDALRVKIANVSYNTAATLGIKPLLGRDFVAGEDRKSMGKVILLSYGLWQRHFGGRADVLGKVLSLDNIPFEVVGVLPKDAVFPGDTDIWMPLGPYFITDQTRGYAAIGRLRRGVSVDQARADLLRIHKSMIPTQPMNQNTEPALARLRDHYLGNYRSVARGLLTTVGLVLLIACVNVAGLMLARGKARSKELAIRAALGARRRRLIRELMGETLLLAVLGSAAGLAMGWAALRTTTTLAYTTLPSWVNFPFDFRIAIFCIVLTGAAALLAGLAPAFQSSKVDLRGFLVDAAPGATRSPGRKRAMNFLLVGEIAVTFVLLAAGGLMVKAFRQVLNVDPGFEPGGVLTFAIEPAFGWPPDKGRLSRFYDGLLERLRASRGVDSAAIVSLFNLPLLPGPDSYYLRYFQAEGMTPSERNEPPPAALQTLVTPGYFHAMGIALRAGRDFDDRDGMNDGSASIIVDEAFVRRFFPANTDPLGKRVSFWSPKPKWMTVVGVVRDIRRDGLDRAARPGVYVPARQDVFPQMSVVLRGKGDPGTLLSAARGIIYGMDPTVAIFDVLTMQERVDRSLWARRTYSWLFGAFAVIALVLAVGGIYSVISYAVTQRTREIGIRMALGARPTQILGQVLREGMASVAAGVAIGLVGAVFATRLLQSLLVGVSPHDPLAFIAVIAVLGAAAMAACLAPARRASRVDPMRALRAE